MNSNVPPGAAEDPTAPYNEKTKIIKVDISQCLSATVEIVVPKDFDEYEASEGTIKDIIREQIILPSEVILDHSQDCWYVDDFCVSL